jgi:hypothetical protein
MLPDGATDVAGWNPTAGRFSCQAFMNEPQMRAG